MLHNPNTSGQTYLCICDGLARLVAGSLQLCHGGEVGAGGGGAGAPHRHHAVGELHLPSALQHSPPRIRVQLHHPALHELGPKRLNRYPSWFFMSLLVILNILSYS